MGILMAIQAPLIAVAMGQRGMALPTGGHQLIVIIPSWIVSMKDLVAILAGDAVRPSLLTQISKVALVTAATLCSTHRRRQGVIEVHS